MKFAVLAVVMVASCQLVDGRVFEKCELARELLRQNFPRAELENWVCLVYSESSGRTNARGPQNIDGSWDFGLFQINDRFWCAHGAPGGECRVTCESLLSDDITVASRCAQQIKRESHNGFGAWNGWTAHCQGSLPDLSDCNLDERKGGYRFGPSGYNLAYIMMLTGNFLPMKF